MKPLKLPITWHRRFYEASFVFSLLFIAIYAVDVLGLITLEEQLKVNLFVAIAAAATLIVSVIFYFIIQKNQNIRNSFIPSLSIFIVLFASTTFLTAQTDGIASPFILLWVLLASFSGIFGAFGWVSVITISGIYMATSYTGGELDASLAVQLVIGGLLPAIVSGLLWREDPGADDAISRNTKNLASELSEVAAKSEIIINAISDGVIAIDARGVVELINPAAQKILGIPKQDALMLNHKSVLKLNSEEGTDLEDSQNPILEVLNTNQQAADSKLVALTSSGKKIGISLAVSPIGEPGSGVIAVFRDVTKERSEEREQAEFISTASHEMRTPVASIEGYLGLAMNPATAQVDERAKGFIAKAHESAQHLGRLFQDLLDVSKSEDGRMTSIPKVVDVSTIAETVVVGLTQKAQEKGINIVFRPSQVTGAKRLSPVFYVNQDNSHIREILDNLVENAIKYTIDGEVSVDIEGTDDKVVIKVKDSGLGIPAEDLPHLFQKFYRVENMDRQEIGGTGLGLYLSRRLAESMHGRLWVESEYGKGSTFFFELPRIDNETATSLKRQQDEAEAHAQAQHEAQVQRAAFDQTNQPISPAQQPSARAAQPQPQPQQVSAPAASQSESQQPAYAVPRGEVLSDAEKAARVKMLEDLAKQQREGEQQ